MRPGNEEHSSTLTEQATSRCEESTLTILGMHLHEMETLCFIATFDYVGG